MLSMGATILLGVAMNAIGRSQVFGLSASLVWFPADNIGTIVMLLAFRVTHNDFWQNVTGYFPGPILNNLPNYLLPKGGQTVGAPPLVTISSTQALLVILAYCVIFALVAITLTWRRDVQEWQQTGNLAGHAQEVALLYTAGLALLTKRHRI